MKPVFKWISVTILLAAVLGIAASNRSGSAEQTLFQDTDGNGYQEEYRLTNQLLQVYENNHLIWQSPKTWEIKQICLADADNDKQTELLMVVWKHGSFGNSQPFWLKGPDNEFTCHLFLYRMVPGRLKEVWCSSALVNPIISMNVVDNNQDGLNELVVLEGPRTGFAYSLRQIWQQQETVWVWDNWGFKRLD